MNGLISLHNRFKSVRRMMVRQCMQETLLQPSNYHLESPITDIPFEMFHISEEPFSRLFLEARSQVVYLELHVH